MKLTYIQDVIGNNYIGLDIPKWMVEPYINQMKEIIDNDKLFDEYIKNKEARDRGHYHITVINVMDFNQLTKKLGSKFIESLEVPFDIEITDLELLGVGTAQKNENRAYYVVCKSDILNEVRSRYGLPPIDLHITIGFKWKDVFGVPKNKETIIKPETKFIKTIRSFWIGSGRNFNFLFKISNLNLKEGRLKIINISDENIRFSINQIVHNAKLIDDKLWITNEYGLTDEEFLTEEEILEILNKK